MREKVRLVSEWISCINGKLPPDSELDFAIIFEDVLDAARYRGGSSITLRIEHHKDVSDVSRVLTKKVCSKMGIRMEHQAFVICE